jgi:rubredoxin
MKKTIKTKIISSYICPTCKKKQTSAVEWVNASIAYKFNLETTNSEEVDKVYGDHDSWACPECGGDLPYKIAEKITKSLGW